MIVIEKNIPLPSRIRSEKYPFKKMEVGDSFFSQKNFRTLVSATRSAEMRTGMKFVIRSWKDGTRIWRIL